jgi:hypothetical protein
LRGLSAVCSSQGGSLSFLTYGLSIYQFWIVVFAMGKLKCRIRFSMPITTRVDAPAFRESGQTNFCQTLVD